MTLSELWQRSRIWYHELVHGGILAKRVVPGLLEYHCLCGVVLGETTSEMGHETATVAPTVKHSKIRKIRRKTNVEAFPQERKRA